MKIVSVSRRLCLFAFLCAVFIGCLPCKLLAENSEKWANIICEELGCTCVTFGKPGGGGVDLHAIGLVTNQHPLKKLGFEFDNDHYQMTAVRIDTGRYLISLQSMTRPDHQQEKLVALKTNADVVFPVNLPPAPEGKYTWNSAIQYDMEDQVGIRPYAMLEEKPRSFVDTRIMDPDKLAALGFPGIQKDDSGYQLCFLGDGRWEFNSSREGTIGVLAYKNAQWTAEKSAAAAPLLPQPAPAAPPPTAKPDPVSASPVGRTLPDKDSAPPAPAATAPGLLFANSDFEHGDLTNWTASGEAFDHQPTKGDNPTARHRGQPSNHQGDYWIGTYEKYQGADGQHPGDIQGDQPTGTLTSAPFQITGDRITFLVGGGKRPDTSDVALIVSDEAVLNATGNNHESMHRVVWDVTAYKGEYGRILIRDEFSGGWGHINADDFRYETDVSF